MSRAMEKYGNRVLIAINLEISRRSYRYNIKIIFFVRYIVPHVCTYSPTSDSLCEKVEATSFSMVSTASPGGLSTTRTATSDMAVSSHSPTPHCPPRPPTPPRRRKARSQSHVFWRTPPSYRGKKSKYIFKIL